MQLRCLIVMDRHLECHVKVSQKSLKGRERIILPQSQYFVNNKY